MKAYRKYYKNQILPGMMEVETDQAKGLPYPPVQKPYPEGAALLDLVAPDKITLGLMPVWEAIVNRTSRRKYSDDPLSLEELSFLLWGTQGVRYLVRKGLITLRTVPSGGARHPFETYLLINRVDGVEPGLYRYLPVEHKLLQISSGGDGLPERIGEICNGQSFVGAGAVVFIWSVIPGRSEWRYGDDSLKDVLMSVGHICQNLYLACESIGAGTCAIRAYQQEALDALIGVDGEDEIALYLAPVGKV
jgi:SagB-type dehydrogenase family enzyme